MLTSFIIYKTNQYPFFASFYWLYSRLVVDLAAEVKMASRFPSVSEHFCFKQKSHSSETRESNKVLLVFRFSLVNKQIKYSTV